jgi:glyoxylase-like metal-dependent hydrolase (beta-lactamase superfamily II)
MKRILAGVGAVLALLLVAAAVAAWWTFGRTTDIETGKTYGPVTVVKDGYVACYLVDVGAGKFALVDACADRSGEAILAALRERDAGADDVSAVFLTHGHSDHVGATRIFTKAQVFAHPDEIPRIEGKEKHEGSLTKFDDGPTAKVTGRITHEQMIGVGNKLFESFHAPGHTPGNSVLYVSGVVLLGDTGHARDAETVVPPPEQFSDDPLKAAEALAGIADALEGREVDVVLPAHSGPLGLDALKRYADEFHGADK